MLAAQDTPTLYARFDIPIAEFDCGKKCAPYNGGVPYCCDTCHAVPTAYPAEWSYLQSNTTLWHPWEPVENDEKGQLQQEAGNLILIECLGHEKCQREFRSFVCRAFPFFPYLDSRGEFLGLSYYWEYQDRCWVISNLQIVRHEYKIQFIETYEKLLAFMPGERDNFQYHSAEMRRTFQSRRRTIPMLHRDGYTYKINPATEKMGRVAPASLPKYGPYKIADELLFPDEELVHR
jgi:hypothetical protein